MSLDRIPPTQRAAEYKVLRTCRYYMRDTVQSDAKRRERAYSALFDAMQELEIILGRSATEEYE